MECELAQDGIGTAILRVGCREMPVEAEDGHANGADGSLGLVGDLEWVLFLEGVDGFQFAGDFGFDRFDDVFVFEERFQLSDFAMERVGGFEVVRGQVSLHEHGVAWQRDVSAGDGIHENCLAGELAEMGAGFEVEGHAVDGFRGRVEKEPRDVECALLVVEARFLAFEGEGPEGVMPTDRTDLEW